MNEIIVWYGQPALQLIGTTYVECHNATVRLALIRFRGRVDYAAGVCLRRSNSAGLIWPSVE